MVQRNEECVRVVVRCRPMSEKETAQGHKKVIQIDSKACSVTITNPKAHKGDQKGIKNFTYDATYADDAKQEDLYEENFRSLVNSVLGGFNGTIFAYGQTGTGKTFTMEGVRTDENLKGVIPRSFDHIFTHISRTTDEQYLVRASYLEIYQEEIRDLLSKDQSKRLQLKERGDTGVQVKDLLSFVVKSVVEIEHVMNVGNQNRSVGATNMNEHSSRSHAIFTIYIECSRKDALGDDHIRVGRLNMVDLAGSERQTKTGATGERLKEATKINLSLSALGNVISALIDGKGHIPYRDSKLTRLLQDSLGGNAKTIMVANVGPANYNFDESMTTLRYANRAKNIKNIPKINEDPKDAKMREYKDEIDKLKRQLADRGLGDGAPSGEELMEQAKAQISQAKEMAEAEKIKIMEEAKKKSNELKKQKRAQEKMESELKKMQEKLLQGGINIKDRTTQQDKEIEVKRQKLAEERLKEREIQAQLRQQEEREESARENYNDLQQEVDIKTQKLKKLYNKLQSTKGEIEDINEEHRNRMRDLEQTLDALIRENKFYRMILDNFVPVEESRKLENRAEFDDERETWRFRPIAEAAGIKAMMKRPESAAGNKRPVSRYAMVKAAETENPRYKCENVLQLELDMPSPTTKEWEGFGTENKIMSIDQSEVGFDSEIVIQAAPRLFSNRSHGFDSSTGISQSNVRSSSTRPMSNRPKTASKNKQKQNQVVSGSHTGQSSNSQFPTSR